jgi:toxin-antitoxin system PIN domain toxin
VSPDVNVLVAAFRADHSHHDAARTWLLRARDECVRGRESLTLLLVVVAGFLRLVTNPRVFTNPDTVKDAIGFLDAILEAPGVALRPPGNEWPLLRNTLLTLGLRGNLVTDAWIASAVQSHSEHLVTFDRDFRRLRPARDLTVLGGD